MGPDQIPSIVQQVDEGWLRSDVARLATGERYGLYSPDQHTNAIEYISTSFGESGLTTTQHVFDVDGREGINMVGSKPGASSQELRPLLVSAHYDTAPGAPGADDNASGVAALLECARAVSAVSVQRSIEFVAFDMEEKQPEGAALAGSSTFVKSLDRKKAYEGLYNLEMVGYTAGAGTQTYPMGFQLIHPRVYNRVRKSGFRGDFIAVVARGPGIDLGRRFARAASQWVPELEVVAIEMRYQLPILLDTFRSDHVPFWLAGIPAIMLTDTANFRNPHYHAPTDTVDTLNYRFMANVTRALVATVAEHAGIR